MSSSVPSLNSLLKQTNLDDHDEVLKAANGTLKHTKNDQEALHIKVVALLKLDRFDDAIHTFDTAGDNLKQTARLEYAYALYKSGKPEKAAQITRLGSGRGYQHVEAQASYRSENFGRAAELYKILGSDLEEDVEADLRINTGAVDAQLEWTGQGELVHKKKPAREDLEAFETAYNAACGSIARGELGQGEVLLKRTRDLCNSLEDMSEEEKRVELLPIAAQQVYVLARQGRAKEAEQLAQTLDPKSIPDASTRWIAQVNGVATSSTPANPYLAHRLVAQDIDKLRPDHPFRYQSAALTRSRHAADLQTLKFDGTAESTAATIATQSSPNLDAYYNSISVVNAAAHAKNQTGKEALKHILPILGKRPNDIGLLLTIAQLYVFTGNSGSTTALMEAFLARLEQSDNTTELDMRFAPGLVGAIISLYHSAGRKASSQAELARAAAHWRRRTSERSSGVLHLLKAAGRSLLDSPEAEHQSLAKEIFTELHHLDEDDRYAAAGLLAASPDSATPSQSSTLISIDRLISGIDTDALESAGIANPAAAVVATRKRPAEGSKPRRAKRTRQSKLPKDYDPSKKPDSERWLPLRDRSTYRPKGKKGKARQALLSQGSATPAGDSEGSRPATPGLDVVKGKPTAGGGANAKKTKKKSAKR